MREFLVLYSTIFNEKVRFQIVEATSRNEARQKMIDTMAWVCIREILDLWKTKKNYF